MSNSLKILLLLLLYILQLLYPLSTYSQLISDFKVNDDSTNNEQFSAKIGVDSLGNFIAVWRDRRNGRSNIFCQRFNSSGLFLGSNFRINENPDSSSNPDIAVSKSGKFAVTWLDVNNVSFIEAKVKCRFFNADGIALTDEIIINDTIWNVVTVPSISVSNTNEYIITWEQKNILFQRLDSLYNKIGINKKVNDDIGNNQHLNPDITVRQDGSFIITWQDSRPPSTSNSEDIYMQMYSKSGIPFGSNVKVSDGTVLYDKQSDPKISSDTSGRFCISFTNFNLNEVQTNVECQLYNSDGSRHGNNFIVAGSINNEYNSTIFKKKNGDMVLGYVYSNGSRFVPYFQKINSTGILIAGSYFVSNQNIITDKFYSDLAVWNNRIISIWSDERNGNLDIYCNIRSYSNPDTTVNIIHTSSNIPEKFSLAQNYPNPFNNSTKISFEINQSGFYKLDVYDNLGQKINEVLNRNLSVGSYKINFESGDLSSGVYHYILSSPKERLVKSFILLK